MNPRPTPGRALTIHGVIGIALALSLSGCGAIGGYMSGKSAALESYRQTAGPDADLGQARFLLDDFGSLNTHALRTNAATWKVFSTALLMAEAPGMGLPIEHASLPAVLGQFGFFQPDSIGNWDARRAPRPHLVEPMGIPRGMIRGKLTRAIIEVSNLNCSACHAGRTFDEHGAPTRTAWLGLPNTSIDLQAYGNAVYAGLKLAVQDEVAFLETLRRVYPDVSDREWSTLRKHVMPRLRSRMREIAASGDRPFPFTNGGPGSSNGVGSLKFQIGLLDDPGSDDVGFVSIPDLGDRAFRSSLLYDGIYALQGQERFRPMTVAEATPEHVVDLGYIMAYFTVPLAGTSFQTAAARTPDVQQVAGFVSRYRAPEFPGSLDRNLAGQGREIYARRCAQCHGTYALDTDPPRLTAFPNRLVPQEELGTDASRWESVSPHLLARIQGDASNPINRNVALRRNPGYVASLLSGVWATAPYLHNGSVPTLWHLMHPDQRPARFMVGGHRLDYARVGIDGGLDSGGTYRYRSEYQPWSRPFVYDTSLPGRSNRGHVTPFSDMSEDEKRAVLEYLKRL